MLVKTSDPKPGVRLLTLNRPEARNALSTDLLVELAGAITAAVADAQVRVVVLTGEKVFSAGADIKEMDRAGFAALENPRRVDAWRSIENCAKPLIAAVCGYAFGGGAELAMLADFIVAADDARFGQPEINLGIFPGDGATQRLTRLVGQALAMKMILSGEPIDAATALRAGLVAELQPAGALLERSLEIAATIASRGPVAARLAKQAVRSVDESTLTEGLRTERRLLALAFTTEDQKEGMRAFVEKRPPTFAGR